MRFSLCLLIILHGIYLFFACTESIVYSIGIMIFAIAATVIAMSSYEFAKRLNEEFEDYEYKKDEFDE